MAGYEATIVEGMGAVDRNEWDSLAKPYGNPFLSWGLLALLEDSSSICAETGWSPIHILLRKAGRLVAAAPFYIKSHSMGEFVFDMEFAHIAKQAGLPWYPKIVGMVPATPAPAWRVLTAEGEDTSLLALTVIRAAEDAARRAGLAGIHMLWPDEDTTDLLRKDAQRWVEWPHQAFMWKNRGFGDFDGWLATFSKNMRRNIGRERRGIAEAGFRTRMLGPGEVASTPGLLSRMADLYESHNDKFGPWAAKFLTRDFFLRLPEYLPSGWALAAGFDEAAASDGSPVALAFLFEGRDRLYGRYYGVAEEIPGIHFDLCYYRPIEYAIEKRIGSFDPGMGSPHKARRGFESYLAPSFHRPFNSRFFRFMGEVMPEIAEAESAEVKALNLDLPFKHAQG
jgi:predicted N-acyltransferase